MASDTLSASQIILSSGSGAVLTSLLSMSSGLLIRFCLLKLGVCRSLVLIVARTLQ